MSEEKKFYHWTDVTAEKVIREKGDKNEYTVAAGITPSGTVHIGNFREIITVDLVRRALEARGKKVRFIYSWDDYDVFRKVPKNMPKQEELKKELRKPIVDVFDPYGKDESYARHNQISVEEDVKKVGINPEFIYQSKEYRKCRYAKEIRHALKHSKEIRTILDKHRENPFPKDWLPVAVFSKKLDTDEVTNLRYDGEWGLSYDLEDGTTETIDFRKDGNVKLKWRTDWPMRWFIEKVDFEPGGKDHSTAGGSYDTGKEIIKLWNFTAPTYIMYDFINVKGGNGKMSSSKGDVVTLNDVLEVYEPEIVRYIFAGTRANREFAISFDVDVITTYEEFDRVERLFFDVETANEKKTAQAKAAYKLSAVKEIPKSMPYQPGFRHLTTVLQINQLDVDKTIGFFENELKNEFDKERLRTRAICVKNWLEKYAPEEFKFSVQEKCQVKVDEKIRLLLQKIAEKLIEKEWTDKELHEEIYILTRNAEIEPKEFFKIAYNVLINKNKGPRLASFILEIGREKVAELFKQV